MNRYLRGLFLILLLPAQLIAAPLPDGFVYLDESIPGLKQEIRYFSDHNFVGARVDGYEAPRAILTARAAQALAEVQKALAPFHLGIEVFDGYRPQRAVSHFVRWAEDLADQRTKAEFYPGVDKSRLFAEGYIAEKSGHSRGSTVDLTLIALPEGTELDMGTPFDRFGPESWPDFANVSAAQRAHRLLLRTLMEQHGFKPLREEWWHFTLRDEPFPDTCFDFPVR